MKTQSAYKFMEWLVTQKGIFHITDRGEIRTITPSMLTPNKGCCPLQVYTGREVGYIREMRILGMTDDEIEQVMKAADNRLVGNLRKQMTEALGL